MIIDWVAQSGVLAVALAVVFAPGLVIAAILRIRGLALWAMAPVVSTALLGLLALIFGVVGIAWSPLSIAIGLLVGALIAWGVRTALRAAHSPTADAATAEGTSRMLLAGGLGVGILIGALRFGFYVGEPAAVSQTNDAVFHLNALRWILETGSASSLDVSGVIGGTGFYPAAWHAIASSVIVFSGAEIAVAVNMVGLVIAAVVWPLGVAWLTRTAAGAVWTSAPALAAALSPALLAFPLLMFEWGVLYPFALSVALLPSATALIVGGPEWVGVDAAAGRDQAHRAVLLGLLAVLAAAAIALSQPAVILAWALLVMIWFTWWAAARWRAATARPRTVLFVSVVLGWTAVTGLWYVLTLSTNGSHWPPFRSKIRALVEVLLNGHVGLPFAIGVSVLALIGLVFSVRHARLRWMATSWLVLSALYVVCANIGEPAVRRWLLGAWYADPYRLAALAPVMVIPLAAVGLAAVGTWAAAAISRRDRRSAMRVAGFWSIAAVGAVGLAGLLIMPVIQMPQVIEGTRDEMSRYASDDDSFLSSDERALLERIDESVPEGGLIIGNPSTGSGFAYVIGGRDVYPRTWSPPRTEEWAVLAERLRYAADDPAVCPALEALGGPDYVLDFGPGEATSGRYVMPGFTGFGSQEGFELVDSVGDASLWRITACS